MRQLSKRDKLPIKNLKIEIKNEMVVQSTFSPAQITTINLKYTWGVHAVLQQDKCNLFMLIYLIGLVIRLIGVV